MRRADRLFRIIQTLRRSRGPVTASKLADELELPNGQIYRDIAALMAQQVPIRGEAGVDYVIDREFDMPPLMLTADELEAAVARRPCSHDGGNDRLTAHVSANSIVLARSLPDGAFAR